MLIQKNQPLKILPKNELNEALDKITEYIKATIIFPNFEAPFRNINKSNKQSYGN